MRAYLDVFELKGLEVLTTDYCWNHTKMDNSYTWNNKDPNNYISFAAPERDLNTIPDYPEFPYPHTAADDSNYNVTTLADAQNFLYIINSENYSSKQDFITSVSATDFDIIIMDLFHNDYVYTSSQINELKVKKNGGNRLVICYMSIGEAEDYRFYWDSSWKTGNPTWLDRENPDWEGNYKVRYWEDDWQDIILTGDDSYLGKILAAGFDGVYLDIIDGFEYFENY